MAKIDNRDQLTPLFRQYFGLCDEHPDCLVLMQCGDFYEAYGEGAEIFARDAEIAITSKDGGQGRRIPMAGVPLYTLESYLRVLVAKGHRVAVAEQTKDPSECKGIVPREVTRIVTAGTILDLQSLDEKDHNYLVCLVLAKDGQVGFSAADISTGDFCASQFTLADWGQIGEEVMRFQPSEVILIGRSGSDEAASLLDWLQTQMSQFNLVKREFNANLDVCRQILLREFKLAVLDGLGLTEYPQGIVALAAMLDYIKHIVLDHPVILDPPRLLASQRSLILDLTTRRNLELTETLLGRERQGSLLGALDSTCTSMGARKLKEWLLRPLCQKERIEERLNRCEELVNGSTQREQLCRCLRSVVDIERLMARVSYGTFNARELLSIAFSLEKVPVIIEVLKGLPGQGTAFADMLQTLGQDLEQLEKLGQLLEAAINPEAPLSIKDGGIIRAGYNQELDELRELHANGQEWLNRLEERERNRTGIKTLKVGYTSVFGYYIEVTKANSQAVPLEYTRKQTLVNSERYIIPELKEHEVKVLGAQERIKKLEYELFQQIRQEAAGYAPVLRRLAKIVAELDVYACLAGKAQKNNWVRPLLCEAPGVEIINGRHPVVEQTLGEFVPNDCYLDGKKPVIILTGPNMSGKSTWLRQTAQIVVLAQMGSFVPAERASLSIFDRIFTRVGASDDLHLGQSTFMVEMSETANIVNNATAKSLVVLDEIGRGTSTFDGLAIAQAVIEYLHDGPKPLTLFATHFHELTKLGRALHGCRNFRVAVKELPDEVVFLHKIVPGGADRSYGIYVAKLAGMPRPILQRAEALLKRMEQESKRKNSTAQLGLDMGEFCPS
ncbi:MAG: DNA mismatch repair protein MutS [bacterium]|nr:DNA mismatch repair protein MutS [bacterium]